MITVTCAINNCTREIVTFICDEISLKHCILQQKWIKRLDHSTQRFLMAEFKMANIHIHWIPVHQSENYFHNRIFHFSIVLKCFGVVIGCDKVLKIRMFGCFL